MSGRHLFVILVLALCPAAGAQSTRLSNPAQETGEAPNPDVATQVLEQASLIAVSLPPPKKFKLHDLLTIIVREEKIYESEGELGQDKSFNVQSTLQNFIKLTEGHMGASAFSYGHPNINYTFGGRYKGEGEFDREDKFITRITAEIIDVKPNGTLVFEARKYIKIDEEEDIMALSGTCRSGDVTPDNTILSTQVANLQVRVTHTGAVRDASRRGWVIRLLDLLRPI